jgi:lipopolysaccharide biosynthesis glycosyltransferase
MTAISILSIIRHRKDNSFLEIFVLGDRLIGKDLLWLKSLEEKGENCKVTAVNVDLAPLADCAVGAWKMSANTRLIISKLELFRKYEKILYLDCDTLVVADISDLLNIDLGNFHLAAAVDCGEVNLIGMRIGIPNPDKYFNSGVMLLNLKQIRLEKIDDRWLEIMRNKKQYHLKSLDQDALNITSSENYLLLDQSYNEFSLVETKISKQRIIHYAGTGKPWRDSADVFLSNSIACYCDIYRDFVSRKGDGKMKMFLLRKIVLYRLSHAFTFRSIERYFRKKVIYPIRNGFRFMINFFTAKIRSQ